MSPLFLLGNQILSIILKEWIPLKEFGALDTAFCVNQNNERRIFLCILNSGNFLSNFFKLESKFICDVNFLRWVASRISFSNLTTAHLITIEFRQNNLFQCVKHAKKQIRKLLRITSGLQIVDMESESIQLLFTVVPMICHNLCRFYFHSPQLSTFQINDTANLIAAYCSLLTDCSLFGCIDVSESAVINICGECTNLVKLSTENCLNMTKDLINCITVNCAKLISLNIMGCHRIKKKEIMVLSYYSISNLEFFYTSCYLSNCALKMLSYQNGAHMKELEVCPIVPNNDNIFIDDITFMECFSMVRYPSLIHLNISNNSRLTINSLESISYDLPNLQYLNIQGLPFTIDQIINISDNFFPNIIKQLVFDEFAIVDKIYHKKQSVLLQAVSRDSINIVKHLITMGANLNVQESNNGGFSALLMAINKQCSQIVRLLAEAGADLNLPSEENRNTALMITIKTNDLETMDYLTKQGAELDAVNLQGNSALMCALLEDSNGIYNKKILQYFIKAGANINIRNKMGQTALTMVVESHSDRLDIFHMLLNAKVDVNKKNKDGISALMLAVIKGHDEMVSRLLKCGAQTVHTYLADKRSKVILKKSALILSLLEPAPSLSIFRQILNAGCDVNVLDEHKNTALFHAVEKRLKIQFGYLINAGADVSWSNNDGISPLMMAAKLGHVHMVTWLMKLGAHVWDSDLKNNTLENYAEMCVFNVPKQSIIELISTSKETSIAKGFKPPKPVARDPAEHITIDVDAVDKDLKVRRGISSHNAYFRIFEILDDY